MFAGLILLFSQTYLTSSSSPTSSPSSVSTCSPNPLTPPSLTDCRVRPTPVALQTPSEDLLLIGPSFIEVDRCSGSCSAPLQSAVKCHPSSLAEQEVEVVVANATTDIGKVETFCKTILVERHTACACSCLPRVCPLGQEWRPEICDCECPRSGDRAACRAKGWNWNSESCQCWCPGPILSCSSSYTYDYLGQCQCVPIAFSAAPSVWLLASVFLLVAALVGRRAYLVRREDTDDLDQHRHHRQQGDGSYSSYLLKEDLE